MSDSFNCPRIHRLPESVANQIAAGEVVERPASVVKELIENSLDAAATSIYIDIEQAGIELIRVRDNGQGIHKDDLKLALQPHATSKLTELADLSQIASLGFRGEAIPSIASVSRFKMTSKLADQDQAWSVDNQFVVKPAAHEVGTTVEVHDLFYSTPGRRKFLKTERTEFLHIQSLIRAISLSYCSTGFYIKHNGQDLYRLPACGDDIQQRVKHICGSSFVNKSIPVDSEKSDLHLSGYIGLDEVARSQSDRQYFYVNGRMVRDKHVSHAIRLAYDDRIATGRYPSFILHLNINPAMLDVNVHPAKSEVRFADTRMIHDFIYGSLLDSLKQPVITAVSNTTDDNVAAVGSGEQYNNNIENRVDNRQTAYLAEKSVREDAPHYSSTAIKTALNFQGKPSRQFDAFQKKKTAAQYYPLFSNQFIITNIHDAYYLIDIAKSRVLITSRYLLNNFQVSKIIKRPVLVPISCELSPAKLDFVNNNAALIIQWGFELEQISPVQIGVRAIPSCLAYAEALSLVNDLLDVLLAEGSETEVASILASHVNDSGTELNQDVTLQLISQISNSSFFNKEKMPWLKIEPALLYSLLEGQ